MRSWSANSIEPGQIARMCRLAWLYIDGKAYSLSVQAGYGLVNIVSFKCCVICFYKSVFIYLHCTLAGDLRQ